MDTWDVHVHLGSLVPPWERGGREESETSHANRCVRKAQDNLFAGVTSLRTAGDRFVSGDSAWSRAAAGQDEFRRRARALLWKAAWS